MMARALSVVGFLLAVVGVRSSSVATDPQACTREMRFIAKSIDSFLPKIDDNEDGFMSLGEIYHHLGRVMRTHHEDFNGSMRLGFGPADLDGSMGLSQAEYLKSELRAAEEAQYGWAVTGDEHEQTLTKHGGKIFMLLDQDGNGMLSIDEHARRSGIDADIFQLMHVADVNQDGKISRAEMLKSEGRIPAHLEYFLSKVN